MPWRLIQFIILFAVFLLFIIFNLENRCDISFGFTKVANVPVFLTVFCTFIAGLLCAFPFVLAFRPRRKEKGVSGKGLLAKASRKQGNWSSASEKDDKKAGDSSAPDSRYYGID